MSPGSGSSTTPRSSSTSRATSFTSAWPRLLMSTESVATPPGSQEATQAFYAKILETGHAAMTGSPATPESMARALVATLSLPRDISVDLIEVRAAQAGLPEGAKQVAGATQ